MKPLLLAASLALAGCASRADFLKFQYDELSRDEKIVDALSRLADNQLVMAKKLTERQATENQDDRRFLRAGRSAARNTEEEFQRALDDAQRELDAFMKIGKKP